MSDVPQSRRHGRSQGRLTVFMATLIVVAYPCYLLSLQTKKSLFGQGEKSIICIQIYLCVGLFVMLPWTIWKVTVEWYAGDVLCKVLRFCQSVVTYASTYMLVSMSIDRLDAIARPLSFTGSTLRARILVILGWALSFIFSLPMLFINEEIERADGTVQCMITLHERWQWQLYVTTIALAIFILPAVIISVCYGIIIYIIWSKSKYIAAPTSNSKLSRKFTNRNKECLCGDSMKNSASSSSSSSRGVIPQAKIKTVKMTLLIVIMFIICWSPYFMMNLFDVYGHIPHTPHKMAVSVFIQSLAPLNSLANPIIYGCFSSRICTNLRRLPLFDYICERLCPCCPGISAPQRSHSAYSTSMTNYTSMIDQESRLTGHTPMSFRSRAMSGNSLHGVRAHLKTPEADILMTNIKDEKL